jgi:putative Holliday junction resolvase
MISLGVDWGRVRVGVAVSDGLGLMAHPAATLSGESPSRLAEELLRLAREHKAESIVLGLPRNMDGTEGESAAEVRRLAKRLEEAGCAVVLWDERLTTWEAERILVERVGRRGEKRKKAKDELAACLILQSYLDARRDVP